MQPKWVNRFELKPGRWVFEPSAESKALGQAIKAAVEKAWRPPEFYFHLRSGGHVEAVRSHLENTYFLHIDIQDFFGSVNRFRITRCLKSRVGGYAIAREWANASTVRSPDDEKRYMLPYGFVQSPILASLALGESRLGKRLRTIAKFPRTAVSVYVDDIIVSTQEAAPLVSHFAAIKQDAALSGFTLNEVKAAGPALTITAFNIVIAHASIAIEGARLDEMVQAYSLSESAQQKAGILGYVKSVSAEQAEAFAGS